MQKNIAIIISLLSIIVGIVIITLYGKARGGEGAITILGLWGIPCTLLADFLTDLLKIDKFYALVHYFLFFIQYQILALLIFFWRK